MSLFEGDWRKFPEMVAYVEGLKSWVNSYGIAEIIVPDTDGSFPQDKASLLDDIQIHDKLWCIYYGFNDGPTLMQKFVCEADNAYQGSIWDIQVFGECALYIQTRYSTEEVAERPVNISSNFFDVQKGLWLSPRFACPQCSQSEYPVDCDLCEGDEALDLYYDVLDSQGPEFEFPAGSYFLENK